jgi:hypothetical protein
MTTLDILEQPLDLGQSKPKPEANPEPRRLETGRPLRRLQIRLELGSLVHDGGCCLTG